VLGPWLKDRYNIELGENVLVTEDNPDNSSPVDVYLRADLAPFEDVGDTPGTWRGCFSAAEAVTERFDQPMVLRWARTVDFTADLEESLLGAPLLRTTPDFWAETDLATLLGSGQARKDGEDPEGPLPLAVAVTASGPEQPGGERPPRARIVVVGSSEFLSNSMLAGESGLPGHLNFILNTMNWLTGSEDLIGIRATGAEDPPVFLSTMEARSVLWFSTLFTTQLVVLAGLVAWALRRRSQ